jgi:GrpB-like predicted nucleotidyltransferase (UPF0157 family)
MCAEKLAVKIVPYNSEAPKIFEGIKRFIRSIIPSSIKADIEHIGSTAVPGLGGKEVIDILIITKRAHMQRIVESLESKGFKFNPDAGDPPERLFVSGSYKYDTKEIHVHFHITFYGCHEHEDKLLFRDYLRKHPEEAKRYYELKKRWGLEAGSDRRRYVELKTQYIAQVLEKARKELKSCTSE